MFISSIRHLSCLFLALFCAQPLSAERAANAHSQRPLSIQVYATAGQVTPMLGTPEKRKRAVEALRPFQIDKIYLEAVRGDDQPEERVLLEARNYFLEQGFRVATGITTVPGQTFGEAANGDKHRLNYEAPKTHADLTKAFRFMASHFDEILIDDFFCTDDTSGISVRARGDRSWEAYRRKLMSWVGRELAVNPARETNSKVRVLLKFPQWYDRFHLFGWNPVAAPKIFDGICVGTETRNLRTKRFGYVQPTEGYVNYSWMRSLGGDKVEGAWFDALDGQEDLYLMQAFQSILAEADNLILFHLGEIVEDNPITRKFRSRVDSLRLFARHVQGLPRHGIQAYKPAHSPPGEDMYLYDYMTVLGIPLVPTGVTPKRPSSLLLATQAAFDPEIHDYVRDCLQSGSTLLVTPGFLSNIDVATLTLLAGKDSNLGTPAAEFSTDQIWIGEERVPLTTASIFVGLGPLSDQWETLVHGDDQDRQVPLLAQRIVPEGGVVVLLNVETFAREEFGLGKEMYLSPRALGISDWPRAFAAAIRSCLPSTIPFDVEGDPPYAVHALGNGHFAVCSFSAKDQTLNLREKDQGNRTSALSIIKDGAQDGRNPLAVSSSDVSPTNSKGCQSTRLSVLYDSLDRRSEELLRPMGEGGGYRTILPAWEVMLFRAE